MADFPVANPGNIEVMSCIVGDLHSLSTLDKFLLFKPIVTFLCAGIA